MKTSRGGPEPSTGNAAITSATLNLLAPWLLLPPERRPGSARRSRSGSGGARSRRCARWHGSVWRMRSADSNRAKATGCVKLRETIAGASARAAERITAVVKLSLRCGELADLNLQFLYDQSRHLLAIGYNVDDRRLDASFYDLLASEARLASFVGIAQGQLPQEHWFALGRLLTTTRAGPVLISWSGSMFEYLMPLLVMPTYEDTLLDQTCRAVVAVRSSTAASAACPGASRSRGSTRPTCT